MPSSYTTSLRLTLPATGELSGQWGNTVNTGITELLDAAVAGTASISTWGGAGVAYTLSNNSGTADEARKMFIVATGSPGEAKNVICPAVSKFYVFRNDTTGGYALTLKTSGGTGIAVPAGQYKFLYCDGTNVVEMFNSAGALTLSGALSVGGTTTLASNPTLSAGTANQVQFLNASKVLVGSANMTFNGTDLTVSGAVNAGSVNATTLDLTNLEVTNIKAKDGTASMTLADATGVASFSANPTLSGGTANGVLYLNGSKVATSGSALVFDGTRLLVQTTSSNISSSERLTVNGLATTSTSSTTVPAIYAQNSDTTASTNQPYIYLHDGVASRAGLGVNYTDSALVLNGFGGIYFRYGGNGMGTTEGMRLTSTGLGIGTSSPATLLDLRTSNGVSAILRLGSSSSVGNTTVGTIEFYDADADDAGIKSSISNVITGNVGPGGSQGGNLLFSTATSGATPTERMRLDSSGNLGIGTSSPAQKLVVSNAGAQGIEFDPTNGIIQTYNRSGVAYFDMRQYASQIRFFTGSSPTETMRLDASGNLGLGVTPSAWQSAYKALEVGNSLGIIGGSNAADLLYNAFIDSSGNLIYRATDTASYYSLAQGKHRWGVAPSGTAGNAISFTQAMTLDASGNLGVGTTSPSYKLSVVGGISVTLSGQGQIWNGATGVYTTWQYNGTSVGDIGTADETFSGGSTADFGVTSRAGNLVFGTNSTERARITSGGYFKASNGGTYIGSTSPYHELRKTENNADWVALISHAGATAANQFGARVDLAGDPNGASNEFLYCSGGATLRASIRSNGGLANYSANDVNLSDRREKTNFAPAKSYLDTICAIPVQTFNYIDQSEDDPGLTLGVVAQDVQAVAPELVMESNWGTAEDPKMRLSIYQTDLQYALMKCIQELKAQNDELRARVAALEKP